MLDRYNQLTGTIPAGGLTNDQWLYDNLALSECHDFVHASS